MTTDVQYADLMQLVGAEIGGETAESLRELGADLDEIRANVQSAALECFPGTDAADLFAMLDGIAAEEFGIHW
jgi:hypothetical protein